MPTPYQAQHHGASREVRLRRTIATAVVLITMASTVVAFARDRGPTVPPATAADPAPVQPASVQRTLPTPLATLPASDADTRTKAKAHTKKAAAPPSDSPNKGTGTFTAVRVPGAASKAPGKKVVYRLQVEGGLHADTNAIATTVHSVLLDPRGWQGVDHVRFVQAAAHQKAQITIMVASPKTTDKLCAPAKTNSKWSCFNQGKAVLNYQRWLTAMPQFKGNLTGYRQYLINHEVGHGLGHRHQTCPAKGRPAPVMQEQSMGLHGCTAWFWPVSPAKAAAVKHAR